MEQFINDIDIASIKSGETLNRHKIKDSIVYRINEIKDLLKDKELEPLVDFDRTDTEYYSGNDKKYKSIKKMINKKEFDFTHLMKNIGCKLEYKKSGTTGHTFRGFLSDDDGRQMEFAVKICAYPKRDHYGSINNTKRPENAEILMLRLLSYFLVRQLTPHIILPIGTFNTDIKTFISLIDQGYIDKDNTRYLKFVENYEKGEYYPDVSVLICEWANRGDLLEFIKKRFEKFTPKHWKVFFFQIISVLAVIQEKFPAFRHNDLKANNILVHKIDRNDVNFHYHICYKHYVVPNIGYQIKICDFDFACIPSIVDNKKVMADWTKKINVTPEQNRYYDVHYFFNTLIKKGFFPQFMTSEYVPQDAKDFVNRVVPDKFKEGELVYEKGRIKDNFEYLIPIDILEKDEYFDEFRVVKRKEENTIHTTITHSKRKHLLDFLEPIIVKNDEDKTKQVESLYGKEFVTDPKDLLIYNNDDDDD
jgi:hypothetical protein